MGEVVAFCKYNRHAYNNNISCEPKQLDYYNKITQNYSAGEVGEVSEVGVMGVVSLHLYTYSLHFPSVYLF